MKKILSLFSVQFSAILGETLSFGRGKKKKTNKVDWAIILFFVGMSLLAFFYCYSIGGFLLKFGAIEILPSMFMTITSLMLLLTTVFKVKGTIFGFGDYDLIMSLPVKTSAIVASRILLLYGVNLAFSFMVMLPMMIAYGLLARPEVSFYIVSFIALWFIPLVPILVASILGTITTFIAMKFRYSNLVNILLAFIFIILIMLAPLIFNGTEEELMQLGRDLTYQINSLYPLAKMYSQAVINGDIISLLVYAIISIGAFVIYSLVVGKVFKNINSLVMDSRQDSNYQLSEQLQMSPLKALFYKEIKRYFSSATYVMNTAFGVVLLTVGAIALLFVDLDVATEALGTSQIFKEYVPIMITICVLLSSTTMSSISLEGKNLWIVKSLPVPVKTIFLSKIAVNIAILMPVILDVIILSIVFEFTITQGIIMFIMTIISICFISLLGLVINLCFPNLDWTTEVVAVKQSKATFITIFCAMAIVAVQIGIIALFNNFVWTYLIFSLLLLVANLILYKILIKYGRKRFMSLV